MTTQAPAQAFPALPKPKLLGMHGGIPIWGYTAEQLLAAVLADRAQRAADAELAIGRTAIRCIEMAMWPQGIDDEQAYYGRMFAEFIEKEFKGAIDAARQAQPGEKR